MSRTRGERGAVLFLVLLLLVALMLLGSGALYLARRELDVAQAAVRDLRGRLAAEGAVRSVTAGWPGRAAALLKVGTSMAVGPVELDPGVLGLVTVRRLAPELFLVEGRGRQEGWPGEALAARLVWVPHPVEAAKSFTAVAEAGGSVVLGTGGRVEGSTVRAPPSGWEAPCQPFSADLRSLYPDDSLPALGRVEWAGDDPGSLIGPFAAGDLARLASRRVGGSLTPAPSMRSGTCDRDDISNWGSPDEPEGPCGELFPLIVAPDSLVLRGGVGQGTLVVGGSLRLEAGARFAGPVLVVGDLTLGDGARIDGLVRVLGNLEIGGDARIEGSGCAVLRAFAGAEALSGGATPIPIRSWITPF